MTQLDLFKITCDLNYFKKGQKVWEVFATGDLSYKCIGRFRGRGRWIMAWVHCDSANPKEVYRTNPDCRWLGTIEVTNEFYQHYRQIVAKIVKNDYWDVHGI